MNGFGFSDFGFNQNNANPLQCSLPLTNTDATGKPALTKGVGPVTFTRASKQNVLDHEGVLRPVYDGCAAIEGSRVVTNLLLNSTGFADLTVRGGSNGTSLGTKTAGFMAPDNTLTAYRITGALNGSTSSSISGVETGNLPSPLTILRSVWLKSNTGSSQNILLRGAYSIVAAMVTVTSTWTRFTYKATTTTSMLDTFTIGLRGDQPGCSQNMDVLAWQPQLENITSRSNQNPSEYVPTTSAPVTRCFDYLNPFTVDDNGVVTDSGIRTPIANIKGILLEPASTNKCTNYNVIPGDTEGSTLTSGNAVVGDVYKIVARTVLDWEANGTRLSGTANAINATYRINTAITFTASDTAKLVDWAIGTTASSKNPTAISGMTLSGFTQTTGNLVVGATYKINTRTTLDFTTCGAANNNANTVFVATVAGTLGAGDSVDNQSVSLSIVDDTAALQAAGLFALTGAKVYKLDNSLGAGTVLADISGGSNTNPHSFNLVARKVSGVPHPSVRLSVASIGDTAITEASFRLVKAENVIPTGVLRMLVVVGSGSVVHFILNQLEEQPFCTSAIQTAGATAARAATVLSIPTAGNLKANNFSLYMETIFPVTTLVGCAYFQAQVDSSNRVLLYKSADNTLTAFKTNAGVSKPPSGSSDAFSLGAVVKSAMSASSVTGYSLFKDGVKFATQVDATDFITGTTITFNTYGVTRMYIKTLRIYKKPLSDAKIITMTA